LAVTVLHWLGVSKNTNVTQQVILPFGEGHTAVFGASDRMDEHQGRRRSVRTASWRLTQNSSSSKPWTVRYASKMNTTQVLNSSSSTEAMPEIELYDIKTNHLVPLGEEELGRHKNLIDSLEQLLGGAFDPLTDLGRVDSPDVVLHGDSMKLVHRDSSAGLGWRLDDELTWRVASPDTWMSIPVGADSMHAIASRIGHTSGHGSFALSQ
jgi:hypothetical protein